ncbi:MAG: XdhC family protein [Candidatus Promineifilaceae bacterium]
MRDVLASIHAWRQAGQAVALATVVETWGSAPRGVGAKMAMTAGGQIAGSVSGGCVEGAVYEAGSQVLAGGRPRLLHFGVADEAAWEVGLACGGTIEVFVESPAAEVLDRLAALVAADAPYGLSTVIQGPEGLLGKQLLVGPAGGPSGQIGEGLDEAAAGLARVALRAGRSRRVQLPEGGPGAPPIELFVEAGRPAPTLVMVGGVHIAIALTAIARTLGYHTVVVDPRRAFANAGRFPHADAMISAWPQEAFGQIALNGETAVALLTHDPKIDDEALKIVLDSPAFYVGALGSRRTHARRRERLLAAGMPAEQLERIHGPIGLEIGAQSPEEIALAIMAQIVAARHQ